jgi:hypothetical protein
MFNTSRPAWWWGLMLGVHAVGVPMLYAWGRQRGKRVMIERMSGKMQDRNNGIIDVH